MPHASTRVMVAAMGELLDGSIFGPTNPCFGCSPEHPTGFRLRFDRQGDSVVTHFAPGERNQGPPGIMHGGLVMTLADEVAAWAIIALLGKFGFTAKVEGTLERPIRTDEEVTGTSRITRNAGRVVDVEVSLSQAGARAFHGEMRFVVFDRKGAERYLGRSLPEAWARFSR